MAKRKHLPEVSEKSSGLFPVNLDKLNPLQVVEVFKTLVEAKKDYEIVKQQETTKRYAIDRNFEKFSIKQNDKRECLKDYFYNQFSLRKDSLDGIFEKLDMAMDEGNNEIALKALDCIVGIVKDSPLKEIDKIGAAFENDDDELVI